MVDDQESGASFAPRRRLLALGIAVCLAGLPCAAQNAAPGRLDVPYEPSPQPVVEKMLELAKLGSTDVLYDLGSGDGRIVITAARKYGARGVGIDLDPRRVAEARINAEKAGVQDRVTFMVGDLFTADFADATVVTLFLWPDVNLRLRPHLWQQLKVGTRVVSHVWDMGPEWPPEKTVEIQDRKIHYWSITEAQKQAAGK